MKTSNLRAVEPAAIPSEPADFTAARNLADLVATINTGADTRASLTSDDRKVLESISLAATTFAQSLPASETPEASERTAEMLVAESKRYARLSVGMQTIEIAGETIDTPAIESGSVRTMIRRSGESIIEGAASYVAARKKEAADAAARIQGQNEGLETAMKHPLIKAAVELFLVALDTPGDRMGVIGVIQESAASAIRAACGHHQNDIPAGVNWWTLTESAKRMHASKQTKEQTNG